MADPTQVILAAITAIFGGAVVKLIDWMIVRRRGNVVLTLNDRSELKLFIEESRIRQAKTDGRLDEALRRIDELTIKNAELLTKVAVLEQEKRAWDSDRIELQSQLDHSRMDMVSQQRQLESQSLEIDELKARVKQLSHSAES